MKIAIVTGASTGIGRATAIAFAAEGYSVVVNSLKDTAGGDETVSIIGDSSGTSHYAQADVTTEAGVALVFDEAKRVFGANPTVLVNNAGATRTASFGSWSADHWHDMLSTNLTSAALMSQEFAARFSGDGGAIINISSIRGLERFSRIGAAAYAAAKAGVINLTGALARELAPAIRVNSICPGVVRTSYVDRADAALIDQWLAQMAIGRFVEPEEVAQLAVMLTNNAALNGSNIVIDGGWTQSPS